MKVYVSGRLSGASVTSTEVIKAWKERFGAFWPKWDHFYQPLSGIAPDVKRPISVAVVSCRPPFGTYYGHRTKESSPL